MAEIIRAALESQLDAALFKLHRSQNACRQRGRFDHPRPVSPADKGGGRPCLIKVGLSGVEVNRGDVHRRERLLAGLDQQRRIDNLERRRIVHPGLDELDDQRDGHVGIHRCRRPAAHPVREDDVRHRTLVGEALPGVAAQPAALTDVLGAGVLGLIGRLLPEAQANQPLLLPGGVGLGALGFLRQVKVAAAHLGKLLGHPRKVQPRHPMGRKVDPHKDSSLPVAVAVAVFGRAALLLQIFLHPHRRALLISADAAQLPLRSVLLG